MFEGNIQGNIISILIFIFFQLSGIYVMNRILARERFSAAFRCLMGSVAGTLSFQWFPILSAFALDFSIAAHILSILLQCLLCLAVWWKTEKSAALRQSQVIDSGWKKTSFPARLARRRGMYPFLSIREWQCFLKENPCIILMTLILIYFIYCLMTHTIPVSDDGSMHTGQATYGDMNMHLGFITSIAGQESFPPEYSICPGFKLSYPFLCDSISSSLYIWGASLRTAYIVPMIAAICQVMAGFYCFVKYWFARSSTAFIAWVLFFVNGGLGFLYFTSADKLAKNFTEFYFTPTSLGDKNIRWAQIIVNMLIPQRATLFGWAILFPLLALTLCAVRRKNTLCFIIAGVFAGALPMIHTHSFLAFGLICTMWLLYDCKGIAASGKVIHNERLWLLVPLPAGLVLFSILQQINKQEDIISRNGLLLLGIGLGILLLYIIYCLANVFLCGQGRDLLRTWGIFLAVIIVLAVPQLFYWTFGQAGADGFVRGHFNWSNTGDQYVWFYLKNIGVTFALYLPAYFLSKKEDLKTASPLFLIWSVSELAVFQPNDYDNNKLLFVAYLFMCGLAANFVTQLFSRKWNIAFKLAAASVLIFTGTASALLTMGREWVSDYELYSADNVEACRYIEKVTEPDDVILTGTEHNNAVSSLTGRNIVCGAGTFLYYHGIDYYERENDLPAMYESPESSLDLYDKYDVSYVYISPAELGAYAVNEGGLENIGECVYSNNSVKIYKMTER